MRPATSITRRSVLAGGLLVAAGCRHKAPAPRTLHPAADASALAAARADEQALLAAYDAALASAVGAEATGLAADRAAHSSHLAALGRATASASIVAGGDVGALLTSSVDSLRTAAVDAVDGAHAALFASIAASHEVMKGE